jgi:signal transduction histidine kinase
MIPTRRHSLLHPRPPLVAALLLLILGFAGVLAYQAQRAAREHRATAERALNDYAAFVAWGFARHASEYLGSAAFTTLKHTVGEPEKAAEPLALLAGEEDSTMASCGCPIIPVAHYVFRLTVGTGELRFQGKIPPRPVWAELVRTVTAHAHTGYDPHRAFAIVDGIGGEGQTLLVYTLRRDAEGTPISVDGFVTDWRTLAPLFRKVIERERLLPPSLTRGLVADSFFAVRVSNAAGREVYRSPMQYPMQFAASDTLLGPFSGLKAEVILRPSAARQLVIGGLPRSRLPLLLGLLLLTAGVVAATLVQFRREAQFARMRADWVSSVSHELRTPLAQIRMFAETLLLRRTRSEGERQRSLEIIDQEARRLTHLVENVLHFSRTGRGAHRIAPQPVDLATQVEDVVDAFAPLARSRRTDLRVDLQPGVVVPVDAGAFRQMLLNLLDNAVKYGPVNQTIVVRTRMDAACVRVEVDDQGPGIPAGERVRVWQPFRRLERDADSATGGSGIGLSVVRELAMLHGGRTWVEDAPGGGARIVVELPGARHDAPVSEPQEVAV